MLILIYTLIISKLNIFYCLALCFFCYNVLIFIFNEKIRKTRIRSVFLLA